jgi:putative chitinase
MWIRTQPVVSPTTQQVLLPDRQLVTKLADTQDPSWWRVGTTFKGAPVEGFSHKSLMVAVAASPSGSASDLLTTTLAALKQVAPQALPNYLEAIRQGTPLFDHHGIITAQRMAHFMAQALHESGRFTVLRENLSYSKLQRLLDIFGEGNHSAKITTAEAPGLLHNPQALAERVYGLGNPKKAAELGNTNPGDGHRYRGNGILQTTGRDAHRRMGQACGVDFESNPDLVTAAEHALKPALQEWTDGQLNQPADQGDIEKITRRINGGFNGLPERKALFNQIRPLLS